MADYTRAIETAKRLIKAHGARVIMTAPAGGQDAPFPDMAVTTPDAEALYMLSVNAGLARYYKFKVSKDEDRLEGTLLVIFPPTIYAPQYRSSVQWADGLLYYVKAFDVLAPNGTPVLYFAELVR